MEHLFIYAIGPVQEFIATARRSRDLQYGSWMLSELSKAAAREVAHREGLEALIFPAPKSDADLNPNSDLNVANKIVAVVEGDPKGIAEQVEKAIRQRLAEMRDDAFQRISGNEYFKSDLAQRQIDDLLELYWVAVPYTDGQYQQARQRADILLAARKNTRDFRQSWGAMVPKSSLDASRESVIDEAAYPNESQDAKEIERKIKQLFQDFGARRGERLSGVDLLKRLGKRNKLSFPSTSAVAAAPFWAGLGDGRRKALQKQLTDYMRAWQGTDIRGDVSELLYPSRLGEYLTDDEIEAAQKDIDRILRDVLGDSFPQASPYYALLLADGDSMGEKLDSEESPDGHRKFSQKLAEFANEARQTIQHNKGTPIYVGGDDIMAYLPLHTALACLKELNDAFGSFIPDGTLSGGLIIAHHMQPLSEVLQLARQAEKRAKNVDGKNGLCIVYSKRSGADRQIVEKWPRLLDRLVELSKWHRKKLVSRGTAYELQKMYDTLHEIAMPEQEHREMLRAEALRIISRKKESGGERDLPQEVRQQLEAWLSDRAGISVKELALEMIVAIEFATARDLADTSRKEEKA